MRPLRHRLQSSDPADGPDGLSSPQSGNVMHRVAASTSLDLDIIQARAIWGSHLVTYYTRHPLPPRATP